MSKGLSVRESVLIGDNYSGRVASTGMLLECLRCRGGRTREDEMAGGEASPLLDSPLQRPQQSVREGTRSFGLEALEQSLRGCIGLGLEPCHDAGPHSLERILAGSPVAGRLRPRSMRGAALAVVPRDLQTRATPGDGIATMANVDLEKAGLGLLPVAEATDRKTTRCG